MGLKIFKLCIEKQVKNIKELLTNTNINTIDSSNIISYCCYDCGRSCIDCKYLKERGEYLYSHATKKGYKVRQNIDYQSANIKYLVPCKKCHKQGVGETIGFKPRMLT